MRARVLIEGPPRVFGLVFEVDDEFPASLERFLADQNVRTGWFVGLGAFSDATIAYFLTGEKRYAEIAVPEQVEVASLTGDVALKEGAPVVHAHVVLGRRDGSALAGHLMRGVVRPTLEVFLSESQHPLMRRLDERFDLPLIDLGPEGP